MVRTCDDPEPIGSTCRPGSGAATIRGRSAVNFPTPSIRILAPCLLALLDVILELPAQAVVNIPATPTNLTSTTKRMVSYRNQRHSWQSGDGAIHLMVNLGNTPTAQSLALYSSFDSGATWTLMFTLPDTSGFSTSDGILTNTGTGAQLQIMYGTQPPQGAIMYATAQYDSATHSWTVSTPQTVYAQRGEMASVPAFGADTVGNLWCAFTVEDVASQLYGIQMAYQAAGQEDWTDTGLEFGPVDSSTEHGARPVPLAGGIGLLYQADTTLYWAYRLNGAPISAPWTTSTLYTGMPSLTADPYGTHFSVAADADDNLYLAFAGADSELNYMHYGSSEGTWSTVQQLNSATASSGYMQVTIAGSSVVVMTNYESSIEVFQSTNAGESFTLTQLLRHDPPPPDSPLDYQNPRVEAPSNATSPIPVWQQFVSGSTNGLMFFPVPVIP
jgi:hypothetical protein